MYEDDVPVEEKDPDEYDIASLATPEEKMAAFLDHTSKFIKMRLDNDELPGDFLFDRNQLYQMYFVMNRLDAPKMVQLDFIVNFGVPSDVKTEITGIMVHGGGKTSIHSYLDTLEDMVLLKLHKYFFWADKKLHSAFFMEGKDDISEDLLIDFKDEEHQSAFKTSNQLGKKKIVSENGPTPNGHDGADLRKPKMIDLERGINSLTFNEGSMQSGNKNKLIDIADDQDFPSLN